MSEEQENNQQTTAVEETVLEEVPPQEDSLTQTQIDENNADSVQAAIAKAKAIAASLNENLSEDVSRKRPLEGGDMHSEYKRMAGEDPYGNPQAVQQQNMMTNPSNNTLEIMIPNSTVGLVIGRGGETIKDIMNRSGCKVQVDQHPPPEATERRVELTGHPGNVEIAKRLVMAKVEEVSQRQQTQAPVVGAETKSFEIPSAFVGLLIGKAGETIKQINMTTGARVQVVPDAVAGNAPNRGVTINGTPETIAHAKKMIDDLVREGYERNPNANQEQRITVMCPADCVGLVIGKKGDTIRDFQAKSGARINVDQDVHAPERKITISGSYEKVNHAKMLVEGKIAEGRNNHQQRGGAPGHNPYGYGQPSQQPYGMPQYGQGPMGMGMPPQQHQYPYGQPQQQPQPQGPPMGMAQPNYYPQQQQQQQQQPPQQQQQPQPSAPGAPQAQAPAGAQPGVPGQSSQSAGGSAAAGFDMSAYAQYFQNMDPQTAAYYQQYYAQMANDPQQMAAYYAYYQQAAAMQGQGGQPQQGQQQNTQQ
eukprot:GCRY01000376.1.p1 GENE.GCRY01000376.1~~GCRY01000376.1.p1  ORF type:complete len:533 (-),score=114.54 GCRY01000376.1:961-2559(-)